MNKILILLIALIVVSVSFLSGCNEVINGVDIDESIKGQWFAMQDGTSYGFTFYNDGKTCKQSASFGYCMGEYYIVGDKLEFHHPQEEIRAYQNFYDIEMPDKDTLILTTTRDDMFAHDGRLEFMRLN